MILAIRDCGAWGGGRRAGRSLTPQNAGNRIYGTRVFISTFPGGEYPLTPPPPPKKKITPPYPRLPTALQVLLRGPWLYCTGSPFYLNSFCHHRCNLQGSCKRTSPQSLNTMLFCGIRLFQGLHTHRHL